MRCAGGLLAALVLAGGCAGDEAAEGVERERATVFAAASLTEVFEQLDPDARFNFGGSDELAAQLEEGARADVYAAASPRYAARLHNEGLVATPRIFATNTLVLIVPHDNPADVTSFADLRREGVKLVIGAKGVPVGDYTRAALESLNAADVLENVVSNEDDVKGVVAKVAQGEADAGFVYATDVRPVAGEVRALTLPARASVRIEYPIAVVRDAEHAEAAREFVELVLGEEGQQALTQAGFGLP